MTVASRAVLIVEDDPQIRRVLRTLLELEQFRIIEAETAEQGLSAARTYKPDLIIVNYGTNESGFPDFIDSTWGREMRKTVARLQRARIWIDTYQKKVLPNLRNSLDAVEKLFAQGDPGVDVVRVLEIRRNLLKGQEAYLDALWEYSQARADLAAAVGDLDVVLGTGPTPPPAVPR